MKRWDVRHTFKSIDSLNNTFRAAGFTIESSLFCSCIESYLERFSVLRTLAPLYDSLINSLNIIPSLVSKGVVYGLEVIEICSRRWSFVAECSVDLDTRKLEKYRELANPVIWSVRASSFSESNELSIFKSRQVMIREKVSLIAAFHMSMKDGRSCGLDNTSDITHIITLNNETVIPVYNPILERQNLTIRQGSAY